MIRYLVVAACLAGVVVGAEGFTCEDLDVDCPKWKKKMGGDCKGHNEEDWNYMVENCPTTCDACFDAEVLWKAVQKKKEL